MSKIREVAFYGFTKTFFKINFFQCLHFWKSLLEIIFTNGPEIFQSESQQFSNSSVLRLEQCFSKNSTRSGSLVLQSTKSRRTSDVKLNVFSFKNFNILIAKGFKEFWWNHSVKIRGHQGLRISIVFITGAKAPTLLGVAPKLSVENLQPLYFLIENIHIKTFRVI